MSYLSRSHLVFCCCFFIACGDDETTGRVSTSGTTPDRTMDAGRDPAGVDASVPGSSTGRPGLVDAAVPEGFVATNLVFATSSSQSADFATPESADVVCAQRAEEAMLDGRFVAWLSGSNFDAADRLSGAMGGFARTDGLPFAADVEALLAGEILYPPRLDEAGRDLIDGEQLVFTGTDAAGTHYTEGDYTSCANWRDASIDERVRVGELNGTSLVWTAGNGISCDNDARFYCFGNDDAVSYEFVPEVGRIAFVSSVPFEPGGGIQAADALCTGEGNAAGYAGEFGALLALEAQSALDRFEGGDAWTRPDGAVVGEYADLVAGKALRTSISQQADGSYVSTVGVWGGAPDLNTIGSATCDDWQMLDGQAMRGMAAYTDGNFFAQALADCSETILHVYCLQR